MKFFAILAFASVAAAASLDHPFLLPPHALSSAGASGDLKAPHDYDHSALLARGIQESRHPSASAEILTYVDERNEDGYHYAFKTSDGTKAEQTGRVFPGAQPEEGSISVTGSYSYIGDDGQEYIVSYIADENGFRAEGAHLPTPPPIPADILKSLQLTDRTRGQYDSNKSSYDADAGL